MYSNVLMALASRVTKRVFAMRRAPDGSAFQNCGICGVLVAVALIDIHHCEKKMKEAKRFKGVAGKRCIPKISRSINGPLSPYRVFMESFMKDQKKGDLIELDRRGFEQWKNMSEKAKKPFVSRARELDEKHQETLDEEADQIIEVNDEADSAVRVKDDKSQWIYIESSEESE